MPIDRRHFLHHTAVAATAGLLHPGLRALAADDIKVPDGWPKSPFLAGNFFPVHEEVTADNLKVVGSLPKDLNGLLVRNGPNPQFKPPGNYHWFDGDGMLHGVQVADGKASYRNRYVRTAGFEEERKAGKALYGGLLDVPDLKKVQAGANPFKNAANTSVAWHHGKLLAQWEGGEPYEVKVPGLETVGPVTFGGRLNHPWSAHPKIDPVTGEMIGYGYFVRAPFAVMKVIDAKGNVTKSAAVSGLKRPTMMHDFAVTANYAIFPEQAETFDMARAVKGQAPWYFDPKLPTRFGLMPRTGDGPTRWFEAQPGYFFHTLNAYEDGDEVVIYACRAKRFPGAVAFGPGEDDKTPNPSVLYRWRLDLKAGTVKEGPVDDAATEFPRVNDAKLGRKTRFGYAGEDGGDLFGAYRKFDLEKGTAARHPLGDGRFGGEAVFVAKPGAKDEDDGWLLTFVYDKAANTSELVVIGAKDFTAKPVARVLLPVRVPYGFHGTWVPGV